MRTASHREVRERHHQAGINLLAVPPGERGVAVATRDYSCTHLAEQRGNRNARFAKGLIVHYISSWDETDVDFTVDKENLLGSDRPEGSALEK